jgi:hypothetical protein
MLLKSISSRLFAPILILTFHNIEIRPRLLPLIIFWSKEWIDYWLLFNINWAVSQPFPKREQDYKQEIYHVDIKTAPGWANGPKFKLSQEKKKNIMYRVGQFSFQWLIKVHVSWYSPHKMHWNTKKRYQLVFNVSQKINLYDFFRILLPISQQE